MGKADARLGRRLLLVAISLAYLCIRDVGRALSRPSGLCVLREPVVLTFHAVRASETQAFEQQMRKLKGLAHPVFADEVAPSCGRISVAVSFDDGLRSVFENALPIMASLGIPATLFIPTGYLGLAPAWGSFANSFGRHSDSVVSAEVLAQVDPQLVRVGSHTVTHRPLADVERLQCQREMEESKQSLERLLGLPVRMLAFPFGSFSLDTVKLAHEAGYDMLFANVPLVTRDNPPRLVGRLDVSPLDWALEFRLKVAGAYRWLAVAVPAKRAFMRAFRSLGV